MVGEGLQGNLPTGSSEVPGTGNQGTGIEGIGSGTGPGVGPGDQPGNSMMQMLNINKDTPITASLVQSEMRRIKQPPPSLLNRLFGVNYNDLS